MLPETGAGVGYFDAGDTGALLTRPIMGVVAGEVGRDLGTVSTEVSHERLSECAYPQQGYPFECLFARIHAIDSGPQRFGSMLRLKSRKMPRPSIFDPSLSPLRVRAGPVERRVGRPGLTDEVV
jgi:hypothetical protein